MPETWQRQTKHSSRYPNPFHNQITIENHSQASISNISVIDMLGRDILTIKPEKLGTIIVDTESLEKGAYFVKVYNNNDTFTAKMLKE